jgi:hypothetical protein
MLKTKLVIVFLVMLSRYILTSLKLRYDTFKLLVLLLMKIRDCHGIRCQTFVYTMLESLVAIGQETLLTSA